MLFTSTLFNVSPLLSYFLLRYLIDLKYLSVLWGRACPFFNAFLSEFFTLRVD